MIFTVSMTAGVDHDRLEGRQDAIIPRMMQMLSVPIEQAIALLQDAEAAGSRDFCQAAARAWIKRLH